MNPADPQVWADVEAIKQLKARYCRLLDTKDWAAWRDLFTDDFVSDTSQVGGKMVRGRCWAPLRLFPLRPKWNHVGPGHQAGEETATKTA